MNIKGTPMSEESKLDKILRKYSKPIKFSNLEKLPKELEEFFSFCRASVDKTFNNLQDLEKSSLDMEKTFKIFMYYKEKKEIEPISFLLGMIFALSRWNFLEAKITKELSQSQEKSGNYIV